MQGSATAHADDDGVAVVHLARNRAADLYALTRFHIVDDVVKRYGVKGYAGNRLVHDHLNRRSGRARAACCILCMDRGGHFAELDGAGRKRHAVAAIAGNRYVLCQRHAVDRDAHGLARNRRIHLAGERGLRRLCHHPIQGARGDDRHCRCDGRYFAIPCHQHIHRLRARAARSILRIDRCGHAAVIDGAGCKRHAVAAISCDSDVLYQGHAVDR